MARCEIKELYRRLQDEECVCYMIEEGRQTLRQFSSFALWVEGFSKDVIIDLPRWTPKEEREKATEDEINRSEDDQGKEEVASSHLMDISHTSRLQEGGMVVDETARPASQSYGPSPCIISHVSHHTQSDELVGRSPIVWQRKQVSSPFSSSRDRMLLCLTVGKELFEADASCEGVYILQQEMTNRGLLDDVGLLMKSDDRLIAFMACKMMTAVLSSSKKEMVTAVLKGHLLQCLATINACNQSICLVEQANPDNSNKINPHGQTQEVNQGQVNPGQVNPFQVDPGQINNPTHSDPLLNMSRGHDTPDQVKSSQVELDRDLNPIQVNPGQINHAVFTFDLLRLLLIKRSCMDSPHGKVSHRSQRCKRRVTSPTGLKFGDEQGFLAEVLHLLYTLLPDIILSFIPAVTARDLRLSTVGYSYNKTTLLILASFLDLIHALFKGGPVVPQWYNFIFKILLQLMDLLKKYYNDLIVLKKLLDILTVSMNQSTEKNPQSIQSQPSVNHLDTSPDENLLTIATSFVDMIVKDDILDDIPYRSGPVGFGGGDFYSSSGDDAIEGTECGDRTLLRKLCRVTLSSVKILATYKYQHSEMILNEADVSKCFQTLSMYICSKLNLPLISKPPIWIFKLFADQDDCLVWVMLCVLNIHRSLHVLEPLYSFLKDQLNPHKIFIGFLETVAYDPSVLLDLLISSETPFLEYLVQYLHTVIRDWEAFCHSHQEVGSVGSVLHSEQDENDDDVSDDELVTDNLTVCTSQVSEGNDCSGHGSCIDTEQQSSPQPKRMKTDIQRAVMTVTYVDPCPQDTVIKAQIMVDQSSDNSSSSPTNTNKSQPNDSQDQLEEGISLAVSNHGIQVFNQELKGASSQSLEDVMTTLIRLRFLIERISGRDLFPYPIAPLLRLLERVEDMYDNMG